MEYRMNCTAWRNFTKFTSLCTWGQRWNDYILRWKRSWQDQMMVKNLLTGSFRHHRTLNDGSLNWTVHVVDSSVILGKIGPKVKAMMRPNMLKKAEAYASTASLQMYLACIHFVQKNTGCIVLYCILWLQQSCKVSCLKWCELRKWH